jgi:hypothetical protein
MKTHYFNQEKADSDDHLLNMAKMQGYVSQTCLLGGQTVMGLINSGENPCVGCNCDRNKCRGNVKIN